MSWLKKKKTKQDAELEIKFASESFFETFQKKRVVCEVRRRAGGKEEEIDLVFDTLILGSTLVRSYNVRGTLEDILTVSILDPESVDEVIGKAHLSFSEIMCQSTMKEKQRGILWTVDCTKLPPLIFEVTIQDYENLSSSSSGILSKATIKSKAIFSLDGIDTSSILDYTMSIDPEIDSDIANIRKLLNERDKKRPAYVQPLSFKYRPHMDQEFDDEDDFGFEWIEGEEEEEEEEEEGEEDLVDRKKVDEAIEKFKRDFHTSPESPSSPYHEIHKKKVNFNVVYSEAPKMNTTPKNGMVIEGLGKYTGKIKVINFEPLPHGIGTMEYKYYRYNGLHVDGKREKEAILTDLENKKIRIYVSYLNDEPKGNCKIEYANGDMYYGQFKIREKTKDMDMDISKDFLRHGSGFLFSEGACISGTFKDNELSGRGIAEFPNLGRRVIGQWNGSNGLNGTCSISFLDGSFTKCTMNKGVRSGGSEMLLSSGYKMFGSWDIMKRASAEEEEEMMQISKKKGSKKAKKKQKRSDSIVSSPVVSANFIPSEFQKDQHTSSNLLTTNWMVDDGMIRTLKYYTRRQKKEILKKKEMDLIYYNMNNSLAKFKFLNSNQSDLSSGMWIPLLDEPEMKKQLVKLVNELKKVVKRPELIQSISRAISRDEKGYIHRLVLLFCEYVNHFYGEFNKKPSFFFGGGEEEEEGSGGGSSPKKRKKKRRRKKEEESESEKNKKDFIHLRTDIKSFIQFLVFSVSKILLEEFDNEFGKASNRLEKELTLHLSDFIHHRVYDVLIAYYYSEFDTKEQALKQKIHSILLALYSTENKPRVEFYGIKSEEILKDTVGRKAIGSSLSSTDRDILNIMRLTVKLYKSASQGFNESEEESSSTTADEMSLTNMFFVSLRQKIEHLVASRCPFTDELIDLIKTSIALPSPLPPKFWSGQDARLKFSEMRQMIIFLRMSLQCFSQTKILQNLQLILKVYFESEEAFDYLNSSINMLICGYDYASSGEFFKIDPRFVLILQKSLESLLEYLNIFHLRSYDQPTCVRKVLNFRIVSILQTLDYFKEKYIEGTDRPDKKRLIGEFNKFVYLLKKITQGTLDKKKHDLVMHEIYSPIKNFVPSLMLYAQKKGEEEGGGEDASSLFVDKTLFQYVHEKLFSCLILLANNEFPIPHKENVDQIQLELSSYRFFLEFLSQKEKLEAKRENKKSDQLDQEKKEKKGSNEKLYQMFISYLKHLEQQVLIRVKKIDEAKRRNFITPKKKNEEEIEIVEELGSEKKRRSSKTKKMSRPKKNKKAEGYEAISLMKDTVRDLLNIVNSMSHPKFGKFRFLFDICSILVGDYKHMISELKKFGIYDQLIDRPQPPQQLREEFGSFESFDGRMSRMMKRLSTKASKVYSVKGSGERLLKDLLLKKDSYKQSRIGPFLLAIEDYMKFLLIKKEMVELKTAFKRFSFIRKETLESHKSMVLNLSKKCEKLLFNVIKSIYMSISTPSLRRRFLHKHFFSLDFLGIRKKFVPGVKYHRKELPYQKCIEKLSRLGSKKGILVKLKHLREFETSVNEEMKKISGDRSGEPFEEGDKLAVISYILLVTPLNHFVEYNFLVDWDDSRELMMVARYETFMNLVKNLDPYARLNDKLIVVVGNIFNPLKNIIREKITIKQQIQEKKEMTGSSSGSQKNIVKEDINYSWLVKLLDYVYCTVGFLDRDEISIQLDLREVQQKPQQEEQESDFLKSKSWVQTIRWNLESVNGIVKFLGFYVTYNSQSNVLRITFDQKHMPQIYKKIKKLLLSDNYLKEYVKSSNKEN